MRSHLLVVDGSNLFARAWWTMRDATLSELPEKVRGMLAGALRRWEATHLVVALDSPDSFRRELIPGYKGERSGRGGPSTADMTEALRPALGFWGVATREAPGMEADDVIATLVAKAARMEESPAVSILSKDTDLLQLVSDPGFVRVLWPEKGEEQVMDEDAVRRRTGVAPHQLLDFRVMVGGKDSLPRIGWNTDEEKAGQKAPFGFTERRAVQLLGDGATLDHLLGTHAGLTRTEREWMDRCAEEASARREALRLRIDLDLVATGRTQVSALRLQEHFAPVQVIACKPTCIRCGAELDGNARIAGAEVCTACGVAARVGREPAAAAAEAPKKMDACADCQVELVFDPVYEPNRCHADAMVYGRQVAAARDVERATGRSGNVTITGPYRYYLAGVPGESGRRAVVDRETGEVLEEGPWLNMWGLALRKNELMPEPAMAGRG